MGLGFTFIQLGCLPGLPGRGAALGGGGGGRLGGWQQPEAYRAGRYRDYLRLREHCTCGGSVALSSSLYTLLLDLLVDVLDG